MAKTGEVRHEFWRRLLAQQQQSGLSVRAFCHEYGDKEHKFYYWRKRLVQQLPVKFALVETSRGNSVSAEAAELILNSGERLRITAGIDAATLRLVLSVLREPLAARALVNVMMQLDRSLAICLCSPTEEEIGWKFCIGIAMDSRYEPSGWRN